MHSKSKIMDSVGEKLRYYRTESGLTQRELSEMVGISTNYYSEVERGNKMISLDKLVLILNVLGCSADEVFEEVINNKYIIKTSKLAEKISTLSTRNKKKILAIIEAFINTK